jgi:hypothetical protein
MLLSSVKSDGLLAEDISESEVWPWFDNAHECIVTTFVDVTNPEIQRKIWVRYR